MSTILEALKKSEQERKENKVPTLADKPPPPERSRWPWLLVSLALIGIIAAVIYLFTLLPDSDSANSQQSESSQERAATDTAPAAVKVEVISWSPEVEQRFTMINGKLYRVGDYLRAGVVVEDINNDSVVINQRGELSELKP